MGGSFRFSLPSPGQCWVSLDINCLLDIQHWYEGGGGGGGGEISVQHPESSFFFGGGGYFGHSTEKYAVC